MGKHLYLRLALAQASRQPLQVNLYEGARTVDSAIAYRSKRGRGATKIEAPAGGFSKGAYTLDIASNGQIVETLRFRIE